MTFLVICPGYRPCAHGPGFLPKERVPGQNQLTYKLHHITIILVPKPVYSTLLSHHTLQNITPAHYRHANRLSAT